MDQHIKCTRGYKISLKPKHPNHVPRPTVIGENSIGLSRLIFEARRQHANTVCAYHFILRSSHWNWSFRQVATAFIAPDTSRNLWFFFALSLWQITGRSCAYNNVTIWLAFLHFLAHSEWDKGCLNNELVLYFICWTTSTTRHTDDLLLIWCLSQTPWSRCIYKVGGFGLSDQHQKLMIDAGETPPVPNGLSLKGHFSSLVICLLAQAQCQWHAIVQ